VYLETVFPVVENNRVAIPEHTRVMGVMADERRPGRMKGRAQMRLRFTHLIFPDDHELSIVGNLQSLPGSSKNRSVDHEGTIEPVDQIDADVYTMAKATGVGVLGGALSHSGHAGLGYGALIGGGLGLAKVLFTRGDEISLPVGTRVEMVLQHSLIVPEYLSARNDLGDMANARPFIPKEQHARQLPDHQPPDNMRCLRDGRTLQCVP
jgi:type IV secretion system protein VirB10